MNPDVLERLLTAMFRERAGAVRVTGADLEGVRARLRGSSSKPRRAAVAAIVVALVGLAGVAGVALQRRELVRVVGSAPAGVDARTLVDVVPRGFVLVFDGPLGTRLEWPGAGPGDDPGLDVAELESLRLRRGYVRSWFRTHPAEVFAGELLLVFADSRGPRQLLDAGRWAPLAAGKRFEVPSLPRSTGVLVSKPGSAKAYVLIARGTRLIEVIVEARSQRGARDLAVAMARRQAKVGLFESGGADR